MQPLAINHFSIVTSLGAGSAATLDALRRRRSGLAACDFETAVLDTYVGQVQDSMHTAFDPISACMTAVTIGWRRWASSKTDTPPPSPPRVKIQGRTHRGLHGNEHSGILQTRARVSAPRSTDGSAAGGFSLRRNAEQFLRWRISSGAIWVYKARRGGFLRVFFILAKVFGHAARMIAAGICDAAVVGGVDSLCLTTLYGFHSLGLLSRAPCRPYDVARDGISIGEGAGFALLERAAEKTANCTSLLIGIGESCDGYHMSAPHPDGTGARLAMQTALDSAGLRPADIDYLNLHGTATPTNDASEAKAVDDVLGGAIPSSSTKGSTGHLLGAAGIIEAIISMLAIEHNLLPGSVYTQNVDPALRANYLVENRNARVRRVLSNSFGFGGSNCSRIRGCRLMRCS
jgi:3-oxoacyl-[acyl-carrier-protein] synthase-1